MCQSCHVVTVAVEVRNLEALDRACTRLGWRLDIDRRSHHWFGQWVDDSPLPRGLFESEELYQAMLGLSKEHRRKAMTEYLSKPDHVLFVPGSRYEIGIHRVGERWELAIDEWTQQGMGRNIANKLAQAYSLECAILEAEKHGYSVQEEKQPNGAVKLTCTSYGG